MLVRPRVACIRRRRIENSSCARGEKIGWGPNLVAADAKAWRIKSLCGKNVLQVGAHLRRAARGLGLRQSTVEAERQGVHGGIAANWWTCLLPEPSAFNALCLLASVPFASITHTQPLHYVYIFRSMDSPRRRCCNTRNGDKKWPMHREREQRQLLADSFMLQFAVCWSHNGSLFAEG